MHTKQSYFQNYQDPPPLSKISFQYDNKFIDKGKSVITLFSPDSTMVFEIQCQRLNLFICKSWVFFYINVPRQSLIGYIFMFFPRLGPNHLQFLWFYCHFSVWHITVLKNQYLWSYLAKWSCEFSWDIWLPMSVAWRPLLCLGTKFQPQYSQTEKTFDLNSLNLVFMEMLLEVQNLS